MNIVITMGGLGKRFTDAGYTVPKYQIEAKGKALFDWSMLSLAGYQGLARRYIFVVRQEDDARDFIQEHCRALGIDPVAVVEIDRLTDGQATTALLAEPHWDAEAPLMIYNIDTYVEPHKMQGGALRGDGFIPCFVAEGDRWSFVKLDDTGRATEVREKKRISPYCSLGAYYFQSCALYKRLYQAYYGFGDKLEHGEKYIAPLYNQIIEEGGSVFIEVIDAKHVHVLGTPEELRAFQALPENVKG